MSVFKKVSQLDWLKELAEGAFPFNSVAENHLMDVYRYLLWEQRFRLTSTATDEGKVANGMMTKYYRRLFPMTLSQSMTDYEKKFIAEAEKLRKKMLREAKLRRES